MTTVPTGIDYNALAHFRESLPQVCACTNELGVTLYRMKTAAEIMRYIGPNHINSINHLVFDIDRDMAVLSWADNNCPAPSWAAINPENGHAHLGYSLASPVHYNPESSKKAQRYAAAVSVALGRQLEADPGYAGALTKNPLNPYWPTFCFSDVAYELDTLGAHLELEGFLDARTRLPAEGLGRNCNLFDGLRRIAYRERRATQGWFSFDYFFDHIKRVGLGMNIEFASPLPEREVHHIAKSISKWTWDNMSPEGFRMWGEARRAKSIRVRQERSVTRAERIRDLARAFPGATQRELAAMSGLSVGTVNTALKHGTT